MEIRWPFEGLQELTTEKLPPKDKDRWRINFSRVEWDIDIVNGKSTKYANWLTKV